MTLSDSLIAKVQTYQPSTSVKQALGQGAPVFLVGISGAGKDTILGKLLQSSDYHYIISHTTRAPRANNGVMEQDGREYHFVDATTAEKLIDDQAFIEVKAYAGNLYGTSVKEVAGAQNEGKIPLADIEVQGVEEYLKLSDNVASIFVLPPSFDEWLSRLNKRGTLAPEVLRQRMEAAVREFDFALRTNAFIFVINDDLAQAVTEIDAIAHGKHRQANEQAARILAEELQAKTKEYLDTHF